MGHFTTAETDRNLDLVAALQELDGLLYLCIEVVDINIQRKTDLLDINGFLILSGFLLALGLLEPVLAIVDDAAHRRSGLGRNLHQIQILFQSDLVGVPGGHNAQLAAIGIDHSYFLVADFFIDRQILNANAPPLD